MSLVVIAAVVAAGFPLTAASAAEREQRPAINIQNNQQFDAGHGVRSGAGTMEHPYVISGWKVANLRIENTSRHVVIENNTVTGKMVLNWIGDMAHVHHNDIADLRVNQNVRRTGMPTSGEIAHNSFGLVGQLRHWDGVFEHNVIGSSGNLGSRAVNFDGFNGARFASNTIYGYMDARLHGHHHSSGYEGSSHQHAADHNGAGVDHTQRYHRVTIGGNDIRTTHTYALAYLDTNHAGNDRTAPSEQEPSLRLPHVHHTRVLVVGNRLTGAGILVNVFNAIDNRKHLRFAQGSMELRDNRITLGPDGYWSHRDLFGIEVRQARHLELKIGGNTVVGSPADDGVFELFDNSRDAGIFLRTLDKAGVWITHNSVTDRTYGVRAEQFTKDVHWVIRDLKTQNVQETVHSDESVKDSPSSEGEKP